MPLNKAHKLNQTKPIHLPSYLYPHVHIYLSIYLSIYPPRYVYTLFFPLSQTLYIYVSIYLCVLNDGMLISIF